jgi:hypothetical protein
LPVEETNPNEQLEIGLGYAHIGLMTFHPKEHHQRGTLNQERHVQAPTPLACFSSNCPRCPSCHHPAIAPVVSTYCREGLVENEWVCSACGFEWSNRFNGLLA